MVSGRTPSLSQGQRFQLMPDLPAAHVGVALQVVAVVIFVTQLWPRVYGRNRLGKPAGSQGGR